jgi:dCTP deaminase
MEKHRNRRDRVSTGPALMILKSDIVADLLERHEPQGDPLVITPRPDLEELRGSGAGSVDLRLGSWFLMLRHSRASVLDINEELSGKLSSEALTKSHFVPFGEKFILHPRSFVLGSTLEWLRMPNNFAGYVTSRSSWGRRGLIIATATGVHPGFSGCLTLELFNVGQIPIALYPGMAVCQFFIHKTETHTKHTDTSALAGWRKPHLGVIKRDDFADRLRR